jgi:hypothetical protein
MFNRLVINRGLENKVDIKGLAKKFRIKWVIIFAYYSLANRIVKYSYCPIKDALSKIIKSYKED